MASNEDPSPRKPPAKLLDGDAPGTKSQFANDSSALPTYQAATQHSGNQYYPPSGMANGQFAFHNAGMMAPRPNGNLGMSSGVVETRWRILNHEMPHEQYAAMSPENQDRMTQPYWHKRPKGYRIPPGAPEASASAPTSDTKCLSCSGDKGTKKIARIGGGTMCFTCVFTTFGKEATDAWWEEA